jgi:nicotinate phosphoribosyltransferase
VASNDLDEHLITSLKLQGARIDTWGVGTKLITAYDQPALGGVYKLGAVREPDGGWRYPIKLSEQPIKISTPGVAGVRRVWQGGALAGDVIYDRESPARPTPRAGHDLGRARPAGSRWSAIARRSCWCRRWSTARWSARPAT